MPNSKPTDSSSKPFVFSWQRFFLHSSIIGICLLLGLLSWYISKPQSIRLYETSAGQHLAVDVATDVTIALDSNSSVAVTYDKPLQIELLKGNIYFDIGKDAINIPTVQVGNVLFEDTTARFSIRKNNNGGTVSVATGQVGIQLVSSTQRVNALEQADFDDYRISNHQLISTQDVAPWHTAK